MKQAAVFLFKTDASSATYSVYKDEPTRLKKSVRFSRRQYKSKLADDVKSNAGRFFDTLNKLTMALF